LKARAPPAWRPSAACRLQIGEVIGWRNLFWSLSDAMAAIPSRGSTARCCPTSAPPRLSPVHDRGLSGGARHRREGDRLGPHLPALATRATSRTRTSTSTSPATCAAPTASTTRSASRP
jgi:hypothetical protein